MARPPDNGLSFDLEREIRTRRPLLRVLVYGALFYLVGIVLIVMKMKGIEIEPFWRRVDLFAAEPEGEETGENFVDGDAPPRDGAARSRAEAREENRRFREEPVEDNLPDLDEGMSQDAPLSTLAANPIHLADPAGPTPLELLVKKPLATVKCWDKKGFEHDGQECDLPQELGQALAQRLYILDVCRRETSSPSNTGLLHLALEADFIRGGLSFWAGEGTTLRFADRIVPCAAERLKGIALASLAHRYSRYHISTEIDFALRRPQIAVPLAVGTDAPSGQTPTSQTPTTGEAESQPVARVDKIEEALKLAREVPVTKERVRVRKDPVDGEIVGFISKPRKVKLIEKSGDWCHVETKRGTLGWMVCWALDLGNMK